MAAAHPAILDAVSPEICDLRQAYTNCGSSEPTLRMMCDKMQTHLMSARLRKRWEERNTDLLGDEAHKMAGNLCYLCAHSTCDAINRVKRLCRDQALDTADTEVLSELDSLVDAACVQLDALAAALQAILTPAAAAGAVKSSP